MASAAILSQQAAMAATRRQQQDEWTRRGLSQARREAAAMGPASTEVASLPAFQDEATNAHGTGAGRVVTVNGDVFDGYFVNWKRHGFGVQTWFTGEQYKGTWINDEQYEGVFTDAHGVQWTGNFRTNEVKRVQPVYVTRRPEAEMTVFDGLDPRRPAGGDRGDRRDSGTQSKSPRKERAAAAAAASARKRRAAKKRRGAASTPAPAAAAAAGGDEEAAGGDDDEDDEDENGKKKDKTPLDQRIIDVKELLANLHPKLMVRPSSKYPELAPSDTPGPKYDVSTSQPFVRRGAGFTFGGTNHEKGYLYEAVTQCEAPGPKYLPTMAHLPRSPNISLGTAENFRMPFNINPDRKPHMHTGPLKATVDHTLHADDAEFPPSSARYFPAVDRTGHSTSVGYQTRHVQKPTMARAPRLGAMYKGKMRFHSTDLYSQSPGPAAYDVGAVPYGLQSTQHKPPAISMASRGGRDRIHHLKKKDFEPGPGSHYPYHSNYLFPSPAFTIGTADFRYRPEENLYRVPYMGKEFMRENVGIFSPGPAAYTPPRQTFLSDKESGRIGINFNPHIRLAPAGAYGDLSNQ